MELDSKNFSDWMVIKTKIHNSHLDFSKNIFYKEGEIYWMSIGKNVGFEEDGKGDVFARPVIVVKGISRTLFFGIPLTSQPKSGTFFFSIEFNNSTSYGLINQMRSFDTSRISGKCIGHLNKDVLARIRRQLMEVFK